MCMYMKRRRRSGVPAMRQSLSVYLERLAASGRASLPQGDLLELGPPPRLRRTRRLSKALREQRAERL